MQKQNVAASPKTQGQDADKVVVNNTVVNNDDKSINKQAGVNEQVNVTAKESLVPPAESKMEVGLKPDIFQLENYDDVKNTIHIVAQGKGGTGKTEVATYMASFFQRHVPNFPLYCFDLDDNKKSFSAFKAFNVQQFSEIAISKDGTIEIDPTRFDGAFNPILESIDHDAIVVMDTGAGASLWALVDYIRNLDFPSLAAACERSWRFIIHVVISGAAIEESRDSLKRLSELVDNPHVEFVIWGNEFFGELADTYNEIGKEYGMMFQRNIILPPINDTRLRKIMKEMRLENWSVTELFGSPNFNAIDKARVNQHFYGNLGGKPGIFRQLQYLPWHNVKAE